MPADSLLFSIHLPICYNLLKNMIGMIIGLIKVGKYGFG